MEGKSFLGTIVWGIAAGMGVHIGWAIIGAILSFLAGHVG